jgi:cbb3-type cytochrome oxidase subunit 3
MDVDINALRITVTLGSLAAFLAIALWAYLPSRKAAQDAQGRGILEENS